MRILRRFWRETFRDSDENPSSTSLHQESLEDCDKKSLEDSYENLWMILTNNLRES